MATMQSATPTFWSWFGRVPGRPALSSAIQCKDGGWVGLLVRPASFESFRAWVAEVGTPTQLSADDAHWAMLYAPRKGNPVSSAVRELAERLGRDEFADGAARAQTICLPVMDFPSMECHRQFKKNEQFFEVDHAPLGVSLGFTRSPADAMEGEIPIRRAPLLGEDDGRLEKIRSEPVRNAGVASGSIDPARALEGVRVVDFGWVLAGPIGTRFLASMGAEVIRVESSRHADGMRSQEGPNGEPDPNLGGLFNAANAGKKSITVDLTTERGRGLVRDLIARSDVVTNNFRPGALDRMGFGYDTLRELREDIVLLNLPGTHRRGPWSERPTTGNVVMAASGLNLLMGFPGQRPRGYGVAYPDFTSPYFLATAVLAALRMRERTGRGQELDLSQLSATISMLGPEWMAYRASGMAPEPAANRDPNHCPHGVYPTAGTDEWCAIAVADDKEWAALCREMERPELAVDPGYSTLAARKQAEDAVDALLTEWTADQERFALAERLQGLGIAAAPVESLPDTFERDPQLRHHYPRVAHPLAPDVELPVDREAIRYAEGELPVRRGPMLGEHNEEIVREVLGRSEEEYVSLLMDETLS
jgi:benzylsuccinate CoA-transferase BbsF subunit